MACEGLGKRLRDLENGSATTPVVSVPRLVVSGFFCNASARVNQLVAADTSASRKVNLIGSNALTEIPFGVFGIIFSKESQTSCSVIFRGLVSGFAGLIPGAVLFCNESGEISAFSPTTGVVHRLATAISSSEIIYDPYTPLRRST